MVIPLSSSTPQSRTSPPHNPAQKLDNTILNVYTVGTIKLTSLRGVEYKENTNYMEESQDMQEGQVTEETTTPSESNRIHELEAQLVQARQEAADNWNKYLRERAEMENFRKRQERISLDRVQRDKKALFQKILGVMDNIERALLYQETMDRQALQQTLRMIMWQMNERMRAHGTTQ